MIRSFLNCTSSRKDNLADDSVANFYFREKPTAPLSSAIFLEEKVDRLLRWSIAGDTVLSIFFFRLILPPSLLLSPFSLISQFSVPQRNALNCPEAILFHVQLLTYWITVWTRRCTFSRVCDNAQRPEGRLCQYLTGERERERGEEREKKRRWMPTPSR